MARRSEMGLWIIVIFALSVCVIAFLSRLVVSTHRIHFEVILEGTVSEARAQIAKNLLMEGFGLSPGFFKAYPPGYQIEDMQWGRSSGVVRVSEKKASFMVQSDDGFFHLLDETGEVIWALRSDQLIPYLALPILFRVDGKGLQEVIGWLNQMPLGFRNYISSIDVQQRIIYLRAGNVLTTRRWEFFEQFDYDQFIRTMGQKTTYELFSNGRYFIVDRKR